MKRPAGCKCPVGKLVLSGNAVCDEWWVPTFLGTRVKRPCWCGHVRACHPKQKKGRAK